MLKKSLKIGSILLLIFAMVAFIGCDTGSGDTDPDDTPVGPGPGPDDPNVPPPPPPGDEIVTGVTITQATPEMLAGESALFKAEVSGTAADKTVIWTVAIAATDYYHDKPEDGTTIKPRKQDGGLLKIDGGESPGTILTVTATSNADPAFYAETTVTVVKPGPRLFWTPNNVPVITGEEGSINEDGVSVGRLLDIYGKDIRILDGEYIEGQHYSVRRVDNLNNSVQGGTITVTGIADEGTIEVYLNGNVVGDKGPIGITLYPSVLEGADIADIDLEGPGAELVFNVTSSYLIEDLSTLQTISKPLRGSTAPLVLSELLTTDQSEARMRGTVAWSGLTSGTYTHRNQAVARVTVSALESSAAGGVYYHFYTNGIDESTIQARFTAGSPEVAIVDKQPGKLVFTLTYPVSAKTIRAADKEIVDDTYELAVLGDYLYDLVIPDVVSHNQEAPTLLRAKKESSLYSLDQPVIWKSGLSGKNFFGGKTAVAEITISAKVGYTFAGTDISAAYLKTVFGGKNPAVEITKVEDSLVFTLSYYVEKFPITVNDIGPNVSSKVVIPVPGAGPTTSLSVSKNAPFTGGSGAIVWTGLSVQNKFVAGTPPAATVTILAKDGYEFSIAGDLDPGDSLPDGVIGPTAIQKVKYNLGNKLIVTLVYDEVAKTVEYFSLPFTSWPTLTHGSTGSTPSTSNDGFHIQGFGTDKSKFEWGPGKGPSNFDYSVLNGKVRATVTLKPVDGYSFAGINLTSSVTKITTLFTTDYGRKPAYISGTIIGNDLQIVLEYTLDYAVENTAISDTHLGDFNDTATSSLVVGTTNVDVIDPEDLWTIGSDPAHATVAIESLEWSKGTAAANFDPASLVAGNVLTIKISVTPDPYYKFPSYTGSQLKGIGNTISSGSDPTGVTRSVIPAVIRADGVLIATVIFTVDPIKILNTAITVDEVGEISASDFTGGTDVSGYTWDLDTAELTAAHISSTLSTAIIEGKTNGVDLSSIQPGNVVVITITLVADINYVFDEVSIITNLTNANAIKGHVTAGLGTLTKANAGTIGLKLSDDKTKLILSVELTVQP